MANGPSIDQPSLADYLRCNDLARAHSLSVTLLSGGRSNLTFDLTVDDKHWVLRRPPMGQTLATAHDVKREFTVISALHGSDVPVPRPVAFCPDHSVLGAPF
jgi:aminoglycoside phosphotransferase (APT) family kinase protein